MSHEPLEEYAGPATVALDETDSGASGASTEVEVRLRGHFEPIDGTFHWYGRISAAELQDQQHNGAAVRLRTPHGESVGRLSDLDPWGRFRITGTGRPPF